MRKLLINGGRKEKEKEEKEKEQRKKRRTEEIRCKSRFLSQLYVIIPRNI